MNARRADAAGTGDTRIGGSGVEGTTPGDPNAEEPDSWHPRIAAALGGHAVRSMRQIAGGASKQTWAVTLGTDDEGRRAVLRRDGLRPIFEDALTLEQEYDLLRTVHGGGVPIAAPLAWLADLGGRDAILADWLDGESIGTRVVRRAELGEARRRLPGQMGSALAALHTLPTGRAPRLDGPGDLCAWQHRIDRLRADLDRLEAAEPAIEFALARLADRPPTGGPLVVCHGDFRLGNVMVDPAGLVGVLDWEFAHLGDALEDIAFPLVRAWRFGADDLRFGGIAPPDEFLAAYERDTGRAVDRRDLLWWEVLGNLTWAVGSLVQAARHLDGHEVDLELGILGRFSVEMQHEALRLIGTLEEVDRARAA